MQQPVGGLFGPTAPQAKNAGKRCGKLSFRRSLAIHQGAAHEKGAFMLIYRLRGRILQFKGDVRPRFPDDTIVNVALAPEVPFGGVAGISRNAVTDTQMMGRANLSTGRFVLHWDKPLFEAVAPPLRLLILPSR